MTLFVCAYGAWRAPAVRQRGVAALVPGPVLVALVSASPSSGAGPLGGLEAELLHRLWRDELGWFTDTAVQLVGSSAIETRTVWPSGSLIWFRDFGRLGPRGAVCEWPLIEPMVMDRADTYMWTIRPRVDCVGARPDGDYEIPFGVHAGAAGPRRFFKRITVGGPVEDVIGRADSPRANDAAVAALRTGVVLADWHQTIRVWFPGLLPSSALHDVHGTFALGVRVLLKRDGEQVAEEPGHLAITNGVQFAADARLRPLYDAIHRGDNAEIARWTLTYVGDPFVALSDLTATRYWPGTLEVSLSDVLK